MASVGDAIRRLVIQASAPGATQATAELQALAAAQGGVAVASAVTERATTSLDSKFAQLEKRFQTGLRNQEAYAKYQAQVNAAVAQNPALQERANAALAAASEHYGQVSGAQKAFGIATQTANLQIAAFAGGLGITGQILSAFGPLGFAAAVGLGAVQSALSFASDRAHALAEKSKELKEFSEATGLSTTAFQALRSEAGKFGIDSEALASGLSKFTAGFESLRLGSGDLLTQIRRINPAIADQMQRTTDAATAFTLFGKAVEQTDNIFQRNSLLKAGMGKGAATFGAFFETAPDVAGITAAYAAAGKGVDDNLIKKMAQLQIDISKTRSAASSIFSQTFGTATLQEEKEWADTLVKLALAWKGVMDSFTHPPDWFTQFLRVAQTGSFNPQTQAKTMLSQGLSAGAQSSSSAEAISDAVPRTRSYDQIVSDQSVGPAAPAPKTDQALLAEMEKRIALLGSAATATEKYNASLLKLKVGQDGVTLSGEDLNRAIGALQLDKAIAQQNAHNSALGASTPIADLVIAKTQQLQKLLQEGANLSPAQIKFQQDLVAAQALGTFQLDAQTAAEGVRAKTLTMSTEAGLAYSIVQTKINEAIALGKPLTADQIAQLQTSANAFAKAKTSTDQYEDALKTLKDAGQGFTSSFVQGLLQGKTGMDALVGAADALASKMADKALTDLFSGNFLQAGVEAVVAVGASLFSSGEKAKKQHDADVAAWEADAKAYNKWIDTMTGKGPAGSLADAFDGMVSQMSDFVLAAKKAGDTASIDKAFGSSVEFQISSSQKFLATMKATIAGFSDGLGPDSPFLKAATDIGDALDKVQSFVADTRTSLNIQAGSSDFGATANLASDAARASIAAQVNDATVASQKYLLSLLQAAPALSTVQSGLLAVNGTAAALQGALVQLGMSSTDAADAIGKGVTVALDKLKTDFTASLTSRLNTANGASYLNDTVSLLAQHQQDVADASALGLDQAQVTAVFHAEAQKIVNDAGLVGDAFTDFTKQFPDLASVVTQSSDALAAAAKTQQDALNSSAKNILDYVNGLTAGSSSTLAPDQRLSAAQQAYNAKLVLAQSGNSDAQGSIATDAENLRQAAQAFYGSASGYQNILSSIATQLLALPAVQATTDPVLQTMRDVLTAINNQTLSQATDATLISTIRPAIDSGNAAQTATALSTYFNQLNTTADQGLTFSELVAGITGLSRDTTTSGLLTKAQMDALGLSTNATVGQLLTQAQLSALGLSKDATVSALDTSNLARIFNELDGNGNGILEKSELIKAAAQATQTSTSSIAATNTNIDGSTSATNSGVAQNNTKTDTSNVVLGAIKDLQSTAATQLILLQTTLAPAPTLSYTAFNAISGHDQVVTSHETSVLAALLKIVINTGATALNVAASYGHGSLVQAQFASGGLVRGPGTSTSDSIRAMLSNNEYVNTGADVDRLGVGFFDMIRAGGTPAVAVPAPFAVPVRGSNDNGDLITELRASNRALIARIDRLEARLAGASIQGAQLVREGVDEGNALQLETNKRLRRAS